MRLRLERVLNVCTAIVFVALIWLPALDIKLKLDKSPVISENRNPEPRPTLASIEDLEAFPPKFTKFFDDRFGFRRFLIRLHYRIKIFGLGVSPVRSISKAPMASGKREPLTANEIIPQVLVGKDGWFFFGHEQSAENYRGTLNPFGHRDLAMTVEGLTARRDAVEKFGGRYILLIVPNKDTTYPEFMPDEFNVVNPNRRIDQIVPALQGVPRVEVIDLRESLAAAKSRAQVFQKLDTHWSNAGIWVGYDALIRAVAKSHPGVTPHPESDFTPTPTVAESDLAVMLGLKDWTAADTDLIQEQHLVYAPKFERRARTATAYIWPGMPEFRFSTAFEVDDPSLPTAVVFHDSFGWELRPFLAEHFRRIDCYWTSDFFAAPLAQQKPDYVIQVVVERYLIGAPMNGVR